MAGGSPRSLLGAVACNSACMLTAGHGGWPRHPALCRFTDQLPHMKLQHMTAAALGITRVNLGALGPPLVRAFEDRLSGGAQLGRHEVSKVWLWAMQCTSTAGSRPAVLPSPSSTSQCTHALCLC